MAKGIAHGLAESDGIIFKTIPADTYLGRITKIEDSESGPNSKHPGSPMIKVSIRVLSDDEAIDGSIVYLQQLLPGSSWMTEKDNRMQLAALKRLYIACGQEVVDDEFDTDDLMGSELQVVVIEKMYEGKVVNNVNDILPVD